MLHQEALVQLATQASKNMNQMQDFNTEIAKQLLNNNNNMHRITSAIHDVNAWQTTAATEMNNQYNRAQDLEGKARHSNSEKLKDQAAIQ